MRAQALVWIGAILLWPSIATAQATFLGLGDLPGGGTSSEAHDVAGGTAVVVGSSSGSLGFEAFRWEAGSLTSLGTGTAVGVSDDGSAVAISGSVEAFRWTAAGGQVGLGFGGGDASLAAGISGDGTTVAGAWGFISLGGLPATWNSGWFSIPSIPYGLPGGQANDISADGVVVVGAPFDGVIGGGFYYDGTTTTIFTDLPGGGSTSGAMAVSADGTTAVGYGNSVSGQEAMYWTPTGGMVGIGDLPGGSFSSGANDVSGGGTVIVGHAQNALGTVAFVWDAHRGMRDLNSVLATDYSLDLTGWTLTDARGISDDGTMIVGAGTHDGNPEGWLAVIPPECSDGIDNDGDTLSDYPNDPGCVSAMSRIEDPECDDGVDNDSDGDTDHPADAGCVSASSRIEDPECSDSTDNDGDTDIDHPADTGCTAVSDLDEDAGTVYSFSKISYTNGGFVAPLQDQDSFGYAVDFISDDILWGRAVMVGAPGDHASDPESGAIYNVYLTDSGTVSWQWRIGNPDGAASAGDNFGACVATLGDLDGIAGTEVAACAPLDDDGGLDRGALWILHLDTLGYLASTTKISDTQGGFTGVLADEDHLGSGVTSLGDLNGDGVTDIAVAADETDDGGAGRGAIWILFLKSDGTVVSQQKVSDTQGGFTGTLDDNDFFGTDVAKIGDLDGDGLPELAVGAGGDNDGGDNRGAVWILFMNANGTVQSHQKISDTQGGFTGTLDDNDWFGFATSALGDINGDGVPDLAVGERNDAGGGSSRGAVWILYLDTDGTVKSHQKFGDAQGGFPGGGLEDDDHFGSALAPIGDINGDGTSELAVGASGDDDGGTNRGAVWFVSLNGADSDGDGVTDNIDSCIEVHNVYQLDTDGDGRGDACDSDDDGDGLSDYVELLTSNAILADSDDDGLEDGDELAIGADPLDDDTDGDNVLDGSDNCVLTSNPLQENNDVAAQGNACQCGDVDGNGRITEEDVRAMQNNLVGAFQGGSPDFTRCNVIGPYNAGVDDCTVQDVFLATRIQFGIPTELGNDCSAWP